MNIKIYQVDYPDMDADYEKEELFNENFERNDIPPGTDVVFYWYGSSSYDGMGQILFRKNDRWYLHSAGHNSCYGPTDNMNTETGYDSLDSINMSKEYEKEVIPLINYAKSKKVEK